MKRLWYSFLYYLSWGAFVGVSLLLNVCCWPWLWWGNQDAHPRAARRVVRFLFDSWVRWFHATGIVRVSWHGLDRVLPAGAVYVANHPSLIDATVLLSRIDDAVCICKPALFQSPAVGPAARLCRYLSGENMIDVSRDAAARIRSGCSLLIFPEATRTNRDVPLNPLKTSFALIALNARAPVQVITIRVAERFLARGSTWWRLPRELPIRFSVTLGPRREFDAATTPRELVAWTEDALRVALETPIEAALS